MLQVQHIIAILASMTKGQIPKLISLMKDVVADDKVNDSR
jgi:hypothetical protein